MSRRPPRWQRIAAYAVIVRDDQILLCQLSRRLTRAEKWTLPGGGIEHGENPRDAVVREVREETNVEVRDLRYFGSQSWPFPNSLMIAFTAEYAGGELRHDPAELADAKWFPVDALPQLPPRLSIAHALIDATIARMRGAR